MKIDYKKAHYQKKEAGYFEDFILAILEKEGIEIDNLINHDNSSKNNNFKFDAILKNGFPAITQEMVLLEIKYSNSPTFVLNYIQSYLNSGLKIPLVIITLINDSDLVELNKYDSVRVLGSTYISDLINKYPSEWWVFVASCSDINNIKYDPSDKSVHVCNPPLAAVTIGKEISLVADKDTFKNISYIAEADFKKRIKKFKNPAIFIGNGASISFGSDTWETLSDSVFDYLKPEYIDNKEDVKKAIGNTNYSSTSMSKYLIDKKKYLDSIYYSLYRKYSKAMHVGGTLLRSIARIKFNNITMPLISYNYDNFLEMDYEKAFSSKLSSVSSKRQDLKTMEPKVIHIHGILPYKKTSKRSKIILTLEEYYSTYKNNNWVVAKQKEILSKRTCLFVGSSMSDLFQMSIINDVRKRHYSLEEPYSWKCFALLCLKDMSPKDIVAIYSYYFSKGVHIIVVDNYDELPSKLSAMFS